MFGSLASGFLAGTVGLIGGIIVACLAPVRNAFNEYAVLYYTPTALSVITAGVVIFNIWF